MSESLNSDDFKKIANEIASSDEHADSIKQLCFKLSVVPLTDFFEGYHREVEDMKSQTTCSKPTIEDFVDVFKTMELYPSNIVKQKKVTLRDQGRVNSTVVAQKDILPDTSNTDENPSASETYNSFKKFQQKLNEVKQKMLENDVTLCHANKLVELESFARQLEKMVPSDNVDTFKQDDVKKLISLMKNMEQLNYIKKNQEVFPSISQTNNIRLENLIEIITYTLTSMNFYQTVF